jgi:two-component system phosphate regulon sensor histidine kinase PhoR
VVWPALAALAAASTLFFVLVPARVEGIAGRELLRAARLVEPEILAALAAEDLTAAVDEIASRGDLRITLVERDGRVLADSAPPEGGVEAMVNHRDRPEVAGALRDGAATAVRRSETRDEDTVYAARLLRRPAGEAVILRLARPLPSLAAARRDLAITFALAAVAALAAASAAWWRLDRRWFRPLARLIHDAETMAARGRGRLEPPAAEELAAFASAVNRLADRIEEQVAEVAAQRDRLEAILASLPDGVLVTAADGRTASANRAFRDLFGLGDRPIEGRWPAEVVRQPLLAAVVERTLAERSTAGGSLEVLGAERRLVSLQGTPLGGSAAAGGAVVVARDVTAVERLNEVRRDFVANVSHELRTPLAAIRAYTETLRDGALNDEEAAPRFLERVLAQCRRLQALLDDLLTLSRLEAPAEARGERLAVDLAQVARRAVETVAGATREKEVSVSLDAGPVPPISGDADALERLVSNLLDNAVKYNRPGGRVAVAVRRVEDGVEIEVSDTGIGIPADALPRIFERFYRVDKARSREEGGTGLGLAIVKHVAQAHGGRVDVESDIGRGTTFRVRLPLSGGRSGDSPS